MKKFQTILMCLMLGFAMFASTGCDEAAIQAFADGFLEGFLGELSGSASL